MNTADRSFALVVATAAAPYGLLFLAGCGFARFLAYRIAADGLDALGRGLLLPATAMLVLLVLGTVAGAASVVRQVSATRRLGEHVDRNRVTTTLPSDTPAGVEVVEHDEAFAFTFGLGEPRVVISRGLVDRLSSDELAAVVAHERYHVCARDPLKLLLARAAARTCFFLPAVRHLMFRYLASRELAADRQSLRNVDRSALAGALFKVVVGPRWDELDAAAAMADPELLAVRIDQLERGDEPRLPRLPVVSVAFSAVVLSTLSGIVAAVALQGGLSMTTSGSTDPFSSIDVAAAVGLGLVCTSGWLWIAVVAFRRLALPGLTTRTRRLLH